MRFKTLSLIVFITLALQASSQSLHSVARIIDPLDSIDIDRVRDIVLDNLDADTAAAADTDTVWQPVLRRHYTLQPYDLRPLVFDRYQLFDSLTFTPAGTFNTPAAYWLDDLNASADFLARVRQQFFIAHPERVRYNERILPKAPGKVVTRIDHNQAKISVDPVSGRSIRAGASVSYERRNWLHTFTGSLQFSQAYLSPNWYQGGNNNLNAIAQAVFNVKLNPAFHPALLFEATASYKLGLNSAPDDSLRSYSISEDLLQLNAKLGYKAARNWFYSMTFQFKTQLLNNYKKNTRTLAAALLSPGELNIGLGMTYSHASPGKRLTIDASLSPLSYNLKTCIHPDMDVTAFGIRQRHKMTNEVGSSGECKFKWIVTGNISYTSRFFIFTDYDYVQGDWENTVNFAINRFLSTQLYVHLRYDSSTPAIADTRWHTWQLKEILSLGFNYKFTSY